MQLEGGERRAKSREPKLSVWYHGMRSEDGVIVLREERDLRGRVWRASVLPERQDLVNHSPSGFEWGFGGSGPQQLALALMADVCRAVTDPPEAGDQVALLLYQEFKWAVVARLGHDEWDLSRQWVDDWRRGGVRTVSA